MSKDILSDMFELQDADPSSPMFSPSNSSSGLGGLPSTYIQVRGSDVLLDDGVIYAKLLKDASVLTKFDSHPDLGQEAWTIWTKDEAPTSRALGELTLNGMRWLLNH